MDHMMPEMDGIETASKIRRLNRNFSSKYFAEVPIIALTANAVVGMKEVFLQNGINDYLPKPIELAKLHNILATWLPKKKIEIILDENRDEQREKEEISVFIFGINTEIGLIQTGGTLDGYLRVLAAICSDMETKIDSMGAALKDGNVKLYKTYVHGFKSVLATIGALPISATAAALEDAANRDDWNYIVSNNDFFVQELIVIYQSIKTFLLNSKVSLEMDKTPQDDMNFLKSELERLKTAVEELKAKTIDEILDGLFAKHWSKEIHDKLEEISQNILIFEWDQALVLIDRLLY
jgi:CheY-like chemotaxis protein